MVLSYYYLWRSDRWRVRPVEPVVAEPETYVGYAFFDFIVTWNEFALQLVWLTLSCIGRRRTVIPGVCVRLVFSEERVGRRLLLLATGHAGLDRHSADPRGHCLGDAPIENAGDHIVRP